MDDPPITDAHQHFWDLDRVYYPWLRDRPMVGFRYGDYGALKRSYLPADYRADAERQNVVRTVHLEAESDPADPVAETRWLHQIAERFGLPHAVVAQARLERDDVAAVLAAQAAFPLVRGIRQKPAAAPAPDRVVRGAPGSMDHPTWRAGYALLAKYDFSYDLQTPYWHLAEAADLARDFPATTIILNHAGLPADRGASGLDAWRAAIADFAAAPNTAIKISGIGQPGEPWTVAANRAIVRDCIEIFGVERAMFASNFPVDRLVADFDTIYHGFQAITRDLTAADRAKLFHENAGRFYRLAQPQSPPSNREQNP